MPLSALDAIERAGAHPLAEALRARRRLVSLALRGMHAAGVQSWGTKSFEFWTLLVAALWTVRPRSLVELGSGRSTQYLAEYALKEVVPFVSVEQGRAWRRRVQRGLAAGLVGGDFVHHVPLGPDGWYDARRLDRLVRFECEALYVDGPVGRQEQLGHGARDTPTARAWLLRKAPTVRLLIVDDVHRPENVDLLHAIVEASGRLESAFLRYRPGARQENVVALAVEREAGSRLREACETLQIAISARLG